jgi:hypothetical protein
MAKTRKAYGHDVSSRVGAKNTIMFHQVLAFNPDECAMNGGKVTPKIAMDYAREYVATRYPNQEVIWVLHKEHCKADNTERYAVHIGINRTNLETGKRLNEGRSKNAKIDRANAVRDMDKKFGLRQMVANERNSVVHARQPTRAEVLLEKRGQVTNKEYIRQAIKVSIKEAKASGNGDKEKVFAEALSRKGVRVKRSKNRNDLTFERKKSGFKVNGTKLGRGFSMAGIAAGLGMRVGIFLANEATRDMER